MPFERVNFIKAKPIRNPALPAAAPMFRRRFTVTESITSAVVHVCGLGYGYYWLNGEPLTEDLFTAPVSDYRKTLWYNSYDVTDRLKEGENVFAVICGNGWYNECLSTAWNHDTAPWRDDPKFILALFVNGKRILTTDYRWKCTEKSPVIYNQLRSGEHFDARLYDPAWTAVNFDDSAWGDAVTDNTPPTGTFRACPCEPIRADRIYPAVTVTDMGGDRYIFDFGQNMSGFIRLTVDQAEGDEITIRYAEQLDADGNPVFNDMDSAHFYKNSAFQTDRLICPGYKFTWSPRFAYHGFRYAEVTGIRNPAPASAAGVFVHQAVEYRSSFDSSDSFLNELFREGQMATLSNLFYMPTDCPTREKLGWCNDAQSSTEQMLTNFVTENLFRKWLRDIYDAMLPDGQLPGIIPTGGWGYKWGNGPASEGILFEIPYRLYLHTGDKQPLIDSLPYMDRSLAYLASREDENGDVTYGLADWAAPKGSSRVCAAFVNSAYRVKFLRIAAMAAGFAGADASVYTEMLEKHLAAHRAKYQNPDGTCKIDRQTSVAMTVYHEIYEGEAELAALTAQLARLVEEKDFHHDCGMVGIRHLYMALNKCGLAEYAYRIIAADGFPGYRYWVEDGATTLYEMWDKSASKNHHMYSDFMSWMMKTVVGIRMTSPAYETVEIAPHFFDGLSYVRGHIDTPRGRISVDWQKEESGVRVMVSVPAGVTAKMGGRVLTAGENTVVM